MNFGFLFSAKAVMPRSLASERRMNTQNKKTFYVPSLWSSVANVIWNNRRSVLNPSDKFCSYAKPRTMYARTHARTSQNKSSVKPGPTKKHKRDVPALTASFCACTAIWLFSVISTARTTATHTTTPMTRTRLDMLLLGSFARTTFPMLSGSRAAASRPRL